VSAYVKKRQPLIFLNACQVGRSGLSLTGIGGWAKQCLAAGASAFIGPYWAVYDQSAYAFAQALYDRLLAGLPIGQAAQEARVTVKSMGDPSWLAYTIFADPAAKVQA
jgi:CHAT domain-containing protein